MINLTNVLLSGMVPDLKKELGVPILCTLQGDDIFLESPARHASPAGARPDPRALPRNGRLHRHLQLLRRLHGWLPGSARERIHVVYPGLNLTGHGGPRPDRNGQPFTIGYFARICPEKGLHLLAEAFRILRQTPDLPPCRLRVSGWLGENNRTLLRRPAKEPGLGWPDRLL